ncbi:aspartate/glutamate racemase family protein [Bosea sp. F3-2]|uniref:aspartate/glutamate racemase family protein n=1 Tax=Bosea sp. F3-2 TaxID=2599640 RepID=UPI0020C0A96E|nr:aspartate/glutamate racemase family protein [Bosea sp. F3-2]
MNGSGSIRTGAVVTDLSIGVLMLDTHFRRLPGDIGNGRTWSFPVQFRVVRGADPAAIVHGRPEEFLKPFIAAALDLVGCGVRGITTSCGFLALLQKELAAALPVPVATSSLLQAPLIEAMLPAGQQVGILTFAAEALTARHLAAVGVRPDTPIEGLPPDSLFRQVYGNRGGESDVAQLEAEVVAAARALVDRHPNVGAILCECTNLPPHSAAVAAATGRPVFDIIGFVEWFGHGISPPGFR